MDHCSSSQRPGITLVETILTIAIMLALTAIVVPSVTSVLGATMEMRTLKEIDQLATAVEHFKLRYGRYPPSKIRLRECGGYDRPVDINDTHDELDQFTEEYLKALFKGIDLELYRNSRGTLWHDWNGDGKPDKPVVLDADECLVFFLGGIPKRQTDGAIALTGFNPDKSRPATPTMPNVTREGPFFEFAGERLAWPYTQRKTANAYPVYCDPFDTPYLYFRLTPGQCKFV